MADYYVSSTAYAAITTYTISTAYTVGQIVKPITPATGARWAMRCTVAGTSAASEPTWPTANNATVVSGGATFANVTGQSAFFWTAAAGDHQTLNGTVGTIRYAAGDRVFLSSDHTETVSSGTVGPGSTITTGFGMIQFLSVNRAGSTPPVAADMLAGAAVTQTSMVIRSRINSFWSGVAFSQTAVSGTITFNDVAATANVTAYFQNCSFYLNNATSGNFLNNAIKVVLDNTTLRFGNVNEFWGATNGELVWINTSASIVGAVFPTVLFTLAGGAGTGYIATVRGVDLSSVTGTLVASTNANGSRFLFDSCKIAPAVTRLTTSAQTMDIVELANCFDGTNFISESYQASGAVTTEFTITLAGGATDNVGTFAHKMVSGTNVDKYANPLAGFWMDVNYTTTGSSKTATVEIISSTALNNDEISLELEYLGTASSSLASFANSLPATVLTTASAVTTSTATWNSSPATPQKQKLQVTFTPRTAGRVRARVRLGKASTTTYYDPQVTIT
jgi:hypothetical protein